MMAVNDWTSYCIDLGMLLHMPVVLVLPTKLCPRTTARPRTFPYLGAGICILANLISRVCVRHPWRLKTVGRVDKYIAVIPIWYFELMSNRQSG